MAICQPRITDEGNVWKRKVSDSRRIKESDTDASPGTQFFRKVRMECKEIFSKAGQ